MKNLAICYFQGEEINVFAGFQPVHPIWTFFSKYNDRIKWMDQEEIDFSINLLKNGSKGGMISTLSPEVIEIVSAPIKQELFILQKV